MPTRHYLYVREKKGDKIVKEIVLYDHSPVGIKKSKKWLEEQIENNYYITSENVNKRL